MAWVSCDSRMRQSESQIVAEAARRIFMAVLPAEWRCREQSQDRSIHYIIEVAEANRMTGLTFGVTVRGTKSPRHTGPWIVYPLQSQQLEYYADRCRHPVFLVVVDVDLRQCYWLFVQKYLAEELSVKSWRGQHMVSLKIPNQQQMGNLQEFTRAVIDADARSAAARSDDG